MTYKPLNSTVTALALTSLPLILGSCFSGDLAFTQSQLDARSLSVVSVEGHQFKDHNKNGSLDPYEDWRLSVEQRVADLLDRMTLEEKAGLMAHPALNMGENGTLFEPRPGEESQLPPGMPRFPQPGTSEVILEKQITHVLVRTSERPEVIATWNNNLQEMAETARLGMPMTISSDPRNGFRHDPDATSVRAGAFSEWPEQIGLAATRDPRLVQRFGEIASQEYRAVGIRTALHPMADLATEPRWGRIVGTFGEDAELSAEMTAAYIRGFQGEGGLSPTSVITMTKHFPGGGPQLDGLDPHNDFGQEQVYPGDNFDYHLIPFKAAIAAGAAQIMPYYGIPKEVTGENVAMAYDKEIITGLLREKLGFQGVICSDWGILTLMPWGVEDLSLQQRYAKAIEAGIDQFGGDSNPEQIVTLVTSGSVPEERIDESARRLLKDKFSLGLFENPYVDPERARQIVGSQAFQEEADAAQRKSIVLLKNKANEGRNALPLKQDVKIYVENINPRVAAEYGTVVDQLQKADVALLRLQTAFETRPGFFGRIHLGNLAFAGDERKRLLEVLRSKPTIVSVYLDRPAVIPEIAKHAAALLGTFGARDEALLDIVFGKVDPTGKLPFELPSSMEAVEAQHEDVPGDSDDPLFEFGFGLTY